MAQYKIAWMPEDGVGRDVLEVARIVLHAMKLDGEYNHADIGWGFWKYDMGGTSTTLEMAEAVAAAL